MANPAVDSTAPGARQAPFSLRSVPGGTLVLDLSEPASFDVLRAAMRAGLSGQAEQLKGSTVRIDLGGRDLDLFDLRRLVHLVKDEFGMNVVGLHCTSHALQRLAERELKIKVHLAEPAAVPAPAPERSVEPPGSTEAPLAGQAEEGPTELVREAGPSEDEDDLEGAGRVLTIPGTVRSGAVVRFAGDIQIFGDVNPGAQLIAGGNILVFGALKGLAHAGARGDVPTSTGVGAIILAFDMRPTQLRIGKVIQLPSQSPESAGRHIAPEIAWLSAGSIVTEPYRGRLPSPAQKEST